MLTLTPLEDARLSPGLRRVVARDAPLQARLMVARGQAPLAPGELLTALYQIAHTTDGDGSIVDTAKQTLGKLPERVLAAALGADLDERVIDFAVRVLGSRARASIGVVLSNRHTADETYAFLAAVCDELELELIARNEMRLLRHPPIIESLYRNLRCRHSTATRAVELAVRNDVVLEGIPLFEELKAAILAEAAERGPDGDGEADEAFRAAVAASESVGPDPEAAAMALDDPETIGTMVPLFARETAPGAIVPVGEREIAPGAMVPIGERDAAPGALVPVADPSHAGALVPIVDKPAQPTAAVKPSLSKDEAEEKAKQIKDKKTSTKMRLALSGNAFVRGVLIRDKNRVIALMAIRAPTVTDAEVVRYAANRDLAVDVIRHIASKGEWLRMYAVKRALVNNPKTPLANSMRLITHLTPKDLRALARSKGVASALAKAAHNLLETREGK